MPAIFSYVLPAIAILFALYHLRPWLTFVGLLKLEQQITNDPKAVIRTARERGQSDEAETLIAMGFQPLGTYMENYGVLFSDTSELVFVHDQLSVVCYACDGVDQQLFLVMLSDDGKGNFVRTTTCPAMSEHDVDQKGYIAQTVKADFTEDVLAAHMEAVDCWEAAGFVSTQRRDMQQVVNQATDIFHHRKMKSLVNSCLFTIGLASLTFTAAIPLMASQFLTQWFDVVQAFSLASIGGSIWWIYAKRVEKNTQRNSLSAQAEAELAVGDEAFPKIQARSVSE